MVFERHYYKNEKQAIDQEKIFTHQIVDNRLASRIYKELYNLNSNNKKQFINNGKRIEQTLYQKKKKRVQNANEPMKRCSTSSVIVNTN